MSFFTFSQNNSGGSFVETDDLTHYVIIEANTADEANTRAEFFGIYFDGCEDGRDCNCCGDRWDRASGSGDPVPLIYGHSVYEFKCVFRFTKNEAIIHYLDGNRETVEYGDQK